MCSVRLAPGASVPTVQTFVLVLYAPAPSSDTYTRPAGRASVTVTAVAVVTGCAVLLFTIVSVNVTSLPTAGDGVFTDLVNSRSIGSGVTLIAASSSSTGVGPAWLFGVESTSV